MPGSQRIFRPPGARPGGPAPWEALPAEARRSLSLDRVRAAVAANDPRTPELALPYELPAGREAAVLVPLFEELGETRVVLTRRSSKLRSHTGEVSFPGGRLEPGEEPLMAALREANEEVGIDPDAVEVIGRLNPLSTFSSSSFITPFVGVLSGRPTLRPNPYEVELAFDVALAELVEEGVFAEEIWTRPDEEGERPIYFFDLPNDVVWGATARVLHELLELVTLQPPPPG
jgi:8-oxo-dGTP pyrophosphatase MutT (NUDIX family)